MKIVHVIEKLSLGGGTRSVLALAKYSMIFDPRFTHEVVSLLPAKDEALELAKDAYVKVYYFKSIEEALTIFDSADIVQIEYWNSPAMLDFLSKSLPKMRLLTWFHIAGNHPTQVITNELLDICDAAIATSNFTFNLPIFKKYAENHKNMKLVDWVLAGADFERLQGIEKAPHNNFNVGYIGTVDFVKLHPEFVSMSASIDVPDIKCIICGKTVDANMGKILNQQIRKLKKQDIFEFKGYVSDIKPQISIFDIYGYPVCPNTYASAELNLQEILFAGIPPVVFPYGGISNLIQDRLTGLVVQNKFEYKLAIEFLSQNPSVRQEIGKNGMEFAKHNLGAENTSVKMNKIYRNTIKVNKTKKILRNPEMNIEKICFPRKELRFKGSNLFISSLGRFAQDFLISKYSRNNNEVLRSEKRISRLAHFPIMRSPGYGSIFHYRYYFPDDGYLRLWSGLLLMELGKFESALLDFNSAYRLLDLNRDNLANYIAECERKI